VSVALYFDHNVDLAIVEGLRARGVDVLTAREDDASTLDDELLLERATALGRVLVTNDKDFSAITGRWYREGRHFAGLIRARQEGVSVDAMIHDLEIIAKVMEPEQMIDQIEYVPFPPR